MKIILIIPYVLCFPGVVDAVDTADKHLRGSNRDLQFTGPFQFPAVDFSLATPTPTNPTQQAPPFQFSGPPGVFQVGGGGFPVGGGGIFGPPPGDDNNDTVDNDTADNDTADNDTADNDTADNDTADNDPGFPFPIVFGSFNTQPGPFNTQPGPINTQTGGPFNPQPGPFNPQPGSGGGDDLGAQSCPNQSNPDANAVCSKTTAVPEASGQSFGFAASASFSPSPVNVNVNDCNGSGSFTKGDEICCC
jgi:hypothetical protein